MRKNFKIIFLYTLHVYMIHMIRFQDISAAPARFPLLLFPTPPSPERPPPNTHTHIRTKCPIVMKFCFRFYFFYSTYVYVS